MHITRRFRHLIAANWRFHEHSIGVGAVVEPNKQVGRKLGPSFGFVASEFPVFLDLHRIRTEKNRCLYDIDVRTDKNCEVNLRLTALF